MRRLIAFLIAATLCGCRASRSVSSAAHLDDRRSSAAEMLLKGALRDSLSLHLSVHIDSVVISRAPTTDASEPQAPDAPTRSTAHGVTASLSAVRSKHEMVSVEEAEVAEAQTASDQSKMSKASTTGILPPWWLLLIISAAILASACRRR